MSEAFPQCVYIIVWTGKWHTEGARRANVGKERLYT